MKRVSVPKADGLDAATMILALGVPAASRRIENSVSKRRTFVGRSPSTRGHGGILGEIGDLRFSKTLLPARPKT